MPLKPGSTLNDRYYIEAILGEGGMGAVYRSLDKTNGQPCAVKEFRLQHLPTETEVNESDENAFSGQKKEEIITREKALAQFKREAELLAELDHPNLPKVTDYFAVGQDYYIIMTLIEGKNAATVLASMGGKPLPERAVMVWIKQVMDALIYCHSKGVIHRDIKPANIILTVSGNVFLVDFGIAKLDSPTKQTSIGARVITPGYSPPEQYSLGRTDMRSDIYSLGATMYSMLTGHEPMEAINRLMGMEMPEPRELVPNISLALESVVIRALSLKPEERYQNVSEMQSSIFAGRIRTPEAQQQPTAAFDNTQQVQMPSLRRPSTFTRRGGVQPAEKPKPRKPSQLPQMKEPTDTSGGVFAGKALSEDDDKPEKQPVLVGQNKDEKSSNGGGFIKSLFGIKETPVAPTPIPPKAKKKSKVELDEHVYHVVWTPKGDILAIVTHYGIYLFDRETVRPLWRDDFGWSGNCQVVFSPDGALVAAGVGTEVHVWSLTSGQKIREFVLDENYPVMGINFMQNGALYVAGASRTNGTINIWDLQSGREHMTLVNDRPVVSNVVFSKSGEYVAASWMGTGKGALREGVIQIWDLNSNNEVNSIEIRGNAAPSLDFSPGDEFLAIGSGQAVRHKNLRMTRVSTEGGMVLGRDHATTVIHVEFSPKGDLLSTVGDDGTIKVWGLEDQSELLIEPVNSVKTATCTAFCPKERLVAIGTSDGQMLLRSMG